MQRLPVEVPFGAAEQLLPVAAWLFAQPAAALSWPGAPAVAAPCAALLPFAAPTGTLPAGVCSGCLRLARALQLALVVPILGAVPVALHAPAAAAAELRSRRPFVVQTWPAALAVAVAFLLSAVQDAALPTADCARPAPVALLAVVVPLGAEAIAWRLGLSHVVVVVPAAELPAVARSWPAAQSFLPVVQLLGSTFGLASESTFELVLAEVGASLPKSLMLGLLLRRGFVEDLEVHC